MPIISVQKEAFSIAQAMQDLHDYSQKQHGDFACGATVSFTGTVRDLTGTLNILELEHYPGMTEGQLKEIAQQAENRWPLLGSLIIHRYGPLNTGEDIVLVITKSAHRQAAFDSANFIMDYLKTQATFWKKETQKDGEAYWVDARESDDHALKKWQ